NQIGGRSVVSPARARSSNFFWGALITYLSVDSYHAHAERAPLGIGVDDQKMSTDLIEALGDGAAAAADEGGDARVGEAVVAVDVAVQREVAAPLGQAREQRRGLAAAGKGAVAHAERVERRDVHGD